MAPTPNASRRSRALLVALTTLAVLIGLGAWLRFTGIDFLLPQHPEPDGGKIVFQLDAHEGRIANPEEHDYWGFYPHLISQAARAWPAPDGPEPGATATLEQHRERARSTYARVRRTVAVLSLLVVPATFLLARRFLSSVWSAVAAALVSTSFLHVWFAQQARPHAVACGLDVLVVLAAVWMYARPNVWTWSLGPLAFGLALACLQSGIATGIALVAAIALVREKPLKLWLALGISGLVSAWLALGLYPPSNDPELVSAPIVGWDSKYGMLLLKGHKVIVGLFNGDGLPIVLRGLWEYEPLLFALAAVSIVFALVRRWNYLPVGRDDRYGELKVVLAFTVAYFVVIALYARTYQRFLLPLVPFLAILAAWTLALVARRLKVASSLGALALAAPVLGAEGFATWRLVQVRAQPDTLSRAADWIRANVAPERKLFVFPAIDVALASTDASRAKDASSYDVLGYPWRQWCSAVGEANLPAPHFALAPLPFGAKEMRDLRQDAAQYALALDADYVVVEVYEHYWRSRLLKNAYDGIVLRGQLVARFSPDGERPNDGLPLSYQDDAMPRDVHWLGRVLRAESTGPVVEIYRLR
ncbi:MAG: hypothetical protein IT453_20965 [Planctomycetes bacterium]|nr:hypothetical protein [Planctomycetota bacterium]